MLLVAWPAKRQHRQGVERADLRRPVARESPPAPSRQSRPPARTRAFRGAHYRRRFRFSLHLLASKRVDYTRTNAGAATLDAAERTRGHVDGRRRQHAQCALAPDPQRDGAVRIVAVADPVESQARLLMDKAGVEIPYAADWRAMLDETAADAVLISTPHRDHYRTGARLPRARAPCPGGETDGHRAGPRPAICSNSPPTRGLALGVAYQRHWMPHFVHARELVKDRRAGRDSRCRRLRHPALDRRGAAGASIRN